MDMMEIEAWPREERGSRSCGRLRSQGLVPAVLYGRGEPNVLLTIRAGEAHRILDQHAFVLKISWGGRQENVQVKEVQWDQLGDEIIHADFNRISLTETLFFALPVRIRGEAAGAAEGGVLEIILHEIDVECLPTAVPEDIVVDVADMKVGDTLRVGGLVLPEGVKAVTGADAPVVTVVPPAEAPEEEEAEKLVAEPELIGRAAEGEEAETPRTGDERS